MLVEYYQITKSSLLYLLFGFIVISIAIIALILTINQYNSKYLLLFYFINIWSTDTFAMIGGKLLKGPKLAVAISPNKTWSGLIIAIIGASIVSYFFTTSLNVANNLSEDYQLEGTDLILLSVIIAALGQISDLMISYVKRQFNVKDSGTIIAGHGGVLDRFDSIIITAPILLYCSGLLI
jgi:phosphatidate cytidylyltransferase